MAMGVSASNWCFNAWCGTWFNNINRESLMPETFLQPFTSRLYTNCSLFRGPWVGCQAVGTRPIDEFHDIDTSCHF